MSEEQVAELLGVPVRQIKTDEVDAESAVD